MHENDESRRVLTDLTERWGELWEDVDGILGAVGSLGPATTTAQAWHAYERTKKLREALWSLGRESRDYLKRHHLDRVPLGEHTSADKLKGQD